MKYQYIRTGPDGGWPMSPDIYAKCPLCGFYLSMDPSVDGSCPCENLHKDCGMGRFGAKSGEMKVELYRREE